MRSLSPLAINRREDGAVAVLVAIMLVVFVAMVAIAVDAGGLYLRRRELVNGSDAAAMSAGRTCARGGFDDRFGAPESAADFHVQENAQITGFEVAGPNITEMTTCGLQWGHVSVQYTSEQSLFFAPALGFEHTKPVTTTATASWGLGSNNPVPIVISGLLGENPNCPVPPTGWPTIGQVCSFWYDNDRLSGGNFAFLSMNPAGWGVPEDSNCDGAQSGGTSRLTGWINGTIPASVPLYWTEPTYVCSDSGIRGVGGKDGPNGQLWNAVHDLIGETKDFPINWEGWGVPTGYDAPEQGMIFQNSQIHKYDIIGFAFLTIVDVVSVHEANGGIGTCETRPNNPVVWTAVDQTLDLNTITDQTAGWTGCPGTIPSSIMRPPSPDFLLMPDHPQDPIPVEGTDYTFDETARTITWHGEPGTETQVIFDWYIDPDSGPCGVIPDNSSAMCIVTTWQGSTLDENFQPGTDKNTIIRLCDFAYGTCLDQ
jgi:Putative Flp pilus-assembly TadE/G-like